jgi:hypothetical protein
MEYHKQKASSLPWQHETNTSPAPCKDTSLPWQHDTNVSKAPWPVYKIHRYHGTQPKALGRGQKYKSDDSDMVPTARAAGQQNDSMGHCKHPQLKGPVS